ncbi:AAA family ATPase [Hamadaea sp. NPDC051192]|uniref:AAA family ATPase n=1 Tax=Hamadaea sp. NPDC051192 TaxID=3154940 RepID=UPI00343F5C80
MLVVMCGLPGSGKSTVAVELSRVLRAVVVSVDPIEAAMLRAGVDSGQPTGLAAYVVAEAVAQGALESGLPVVVDAVNDAVEARAQWVGLGTRSAAPVRFVEVVCRDEAVHQARLAARGRRYAELPEPSWDSVVRRRAAFERWRDQRLVVDGARPVGEVVAELVVGLSPTADLG